MKRFVFFVLSFCLVLGSSMAKAKSFYVEAVNSSTISAEKLQESRKKVKEHKDIVVQDKLEVPPFHKRGEWEQDSLSRTFCTGCHLSPPHTKSIRARAFLNMHTQFIACETCHMRPENVKFDYQWFDYRNQQIVKPSVKLFRQIISPDDAPKKGEKKLRVTDVMIKIVPFLDNKMTLILRDNEFAKKSLDIWKKGTLEERVKRRAKIHAPLKEEGPECNDCHQSEQPMLDLKALGANDKQRRNMQNHIVPQFFKRYMEDEQKIRINNLLK